MFIVDALIGNPNRNNGNWGVLLHYDETKDIAPIYDNGNSFFQNWNENKIQEYFTDPKLFESIAYSGRVCVFTLKDKK